MKFLAAFILGFFVAHSAMAATASPVANVGQGSLNNIFKESTTGSAAPIVVPCIGGGDESALNSVTGTSQNAKTAMLLPGGASQPCQMNNMWQLPFATWTSLYMQPSAMNDLNTSIGGGAKTPWLEVNTQTEAQTSPYAAAIDINGARDLVFNNVAMFGTDFTQPSAFFTNSATGDGGGRCCALNSFNAMNSSFGGVGTVFGCPVDGNLNCVLAGGVYTASITAAGSGYTDGTYNKVALTGGSGTNAFADRIVVSGGIVTSVILNDVNGVKYPGGSYAVGNVLSASDANLGGGGGSGFQFTVASITKATPTAPNFKQRLIGDQFSVLSGCLICNNASDLFMWDFQVSGDAGVLYEPIFGGGGSVVANGRIENVSKGFWLGGPNGASINGGDIFANISTDFSGQGYGPSDGVYRTINHSIFEFDAGDGYIVSNINVLRPPTNDPVIKIGGTGQNAALTDVLVTSTIMGLTFGPGSQNSCAEINNAGNGAVPNHIWIQGLICNPGNNATPVKYNVVPTSSIEDTLGSGTFTDSTHTGKGQFWDHSGRPWGITPAASVTPPNANVAADLSQNTSAFGLPVGTTGQRPTVAEGMVRDNTTLHQIEAYVNGAWVSLAGGSSVSVTAGSPNIVVNPTPGTGTFTVGAINIINAQGTTAPYTVLSTDMAEIVTHNKTTAVAVTLPQAGTTGFATGVGYTELNTGAGVVTVTPTTSTINGAASLTLPKGGWVLPFSDGTNWFAIAGTSGSIDGVNPINTGAATLNGLVTLPSITTDATHTDASLCEDTTTHAVYFGSGTAGICLGTSSRRYKENIVSLTDGVAQLDQLKPVAFFYKKGRGDNGAKQQYGFLAEDMVRVFPKLVDLDQEGKPNSVDLVGLIPVLVHGMQEQQKEIAQLKAKLKMK